MKLSQILPLYEAIHISSSDIQKISTMLTTFKSYVNEHIDEFDDEPSLFYDKLRYALQNTIKQILKPYYHNDERYELNITFFETGPYEAEVKGSWINYSGTWYNKLSIRMNNDTLKNIDIKTITDNISHEVTHLIQSLKSPTHSSIGSKKLKDDYYGKTVEIEAYAQSVVSDILHDVLNDKTNIIKNINKYINILKSSHIPYYNDNLLHYKNYKRMYKKAVDEQDFKIWKLFNKKIIQKLQKYKEEYSHPNNSARYDVYQNGEKIDSVWYGINDDVEDIRRGLIDHDGYDETIDVKRTKRKTL